MFRDRADAGRQLGEALRGRIELTAVVVGLARGGVEVAAAVATLLGAPLDALAVRKVGHPRQPEYGLGAVTPGGGVYLRSADGADAAELELVVRQARLDADQLDRELHARHPSYDLGGRECVLVDDGLATGATMIAAVRWARAGGARRVTVAVPVGSPATVERLEQETDAVVCLSQPEHLMAVGAWYADFSQVSGERVLELLDRYHAGAAPG